MAFWLFVNFQWNHVTSQWIIRAHFMYIQVPLHVMDHLRPIHKTSGSGMTSCERDPQKPHYRKFCVRPLKHHFLYNTLDYFQRMGSSITPLPDFQRTGSSKNPLLEFLRTPYTCGVSEDPVRNMFTIQWSLRISCARVFLSRSFGGSRARKLHWQSFWGSRAQWYSFVSYREQGSGDGVCRNSLG